MKVLVCLLLCPGYKYLEGPQHIRVAFPDSSLLRSLTLPLLCPTVVRVLEDRLFPLGWDLGVSSNQPDLILLDVAPKTIENTLKSLVKE